MKTLAIASFAALALLSGAAQAAPKDVWTQINESAPRSTFDQINQTAPLKGYFQDLQDSAPHADGVHGDLDTNAR